MSDVISRAAALDVLVTSPNFHTTLTRIEELPAVDAVPVVHGRWIGYPECLGYDDAYLDEHIVCSVCHSVWNFIDNDAERFDYCPACGARMDGKQTTLPP